MKDIFNTELLTNIIEISFKQTNINAALLSIAITLWIAFFKPYIPRTFYFATAFSLWVCFDIYIYKIRPWIYNHAIERNVRNGNSLKQLSIGDKRIIYQMYKDESFSASIALFGANYMELCDKHIIIPLSTVAINGNMPCRLNSKAIKYLNKHNDYFKELEELNAENFSNLRSRVYGV